MSDEQEATVRHVHVANGEQYEVDVPEAIADDVDQVHDFIARDVARQNTMRAAAESDATPAAPVRSVPAWPPRILTRTSEA